MKPIVRVAVAATFIAVALVGCMTVELKTDTDLPVMMSGAPDAEYTIVRSFEVSQRGWFTLFDLVTITNPGIKESIESELRRAGGDAVINVEIVGQTTFVDGAVPVGMTLAGTLLGQLLAPDPYTGLTYGSALGTLAGAMLSARTYTISGDVIKYRR